MFIEQINSRIIVERSTATSGAIPGRADAGDSLLSSLVGWVMRSAKRRSQRIALSRLSDHVLRDIGLTRVDVEMEIGKSFRRL